MCVIMCVHIYVHTGGYALYVRVGCMVHPMADTHLITGTFQCCVCLYCPYLFVNDIHYGALDNEYWCISINSGGVLTRGQGHLFP